MCFLPFYLKILFIFVVFSPSSDYEKMLHEVVTFLSGIYKDLSNMPSGSV
jgi:hypothetical protein